jgi:chemotaxis protein histidine kinase CheA
MMRGNLKKYMRLLVLFADSNQLQAEQITGMLATGELAAIESIAHSLKGSAGMLGALPVSEAAAAVLAALRGKAAADEISRLCAVLIEELSSLLDGIRQATAERPELAGTKVDTAHSADVLVRLENLLEHGDMAASDLAKDEAALLFAILGEAARPLLAHIESFDYEVAAVELREAGRRVTR